MSTASIPINDDAGQQRPHHIQMVGGGQLPADDANPGDVIGCDDFFRRIHERHVGDVHGRLGNFAVLKFSEAFGILDQFRACRNGVLRGNRPHQVLQAGQHLAGSRQRVLCGLKRRFILRDQIRSVGSIRHGL